MEGDHDDIDPIRPADAPKREHPLIEEIRRATADDALRAAEYKGPALPFRHNGHDREAAMPYLSHVEMAGRVRMLLRTDWTHEMVVCAARDRILHLTQENERLRAAASWQPMDTVPTDDSRFLAKTDDGRAMIWNGKLLATAMASNTPDHLQFPATGWMWIPATDAPPTPLPHDVVRLVIAARVVMDEEASPESLHELDRAAEAFSSRVPYEDEPEEVDANG